MGCCHHYFAPTADGDSAFTIDASTLTFGAGCLKNFVPFLLYGVVLLVLCFVAAIPLGLGFLVLGPVAIASIYAGYRDIFAAD